MYLLSGYAVVFCQFALHFRIGIPHARLVCAKTAELELRAFLLLKLAVVLSNLGGTVRSLVIHMIFVPVGDNEPQIQARLADHIGGYEHLGFLFPFGEFEVPQKFRITRLGKRHQFGNTPILGNAGIFDIIQFFSGLSMQMSCAAR